MKVTIAMTRDNFYHQIGFLRLPRFKKKVIQQFSTETELLYSKCICNNLSPIGVKGNYSKKGKSYVVDIYNHKKVTLDSLLDFIKEVSRRWFVQVEVTHLQPYETEYAASLRKAIESEDLECSLFDFVSEH